MKSGRGADRPPRQIAKLCRDLGITLESLAAETGLEVDSLRKIASGRRNPLLTTALSLAEALGVEVEELFADCADGRDGDSAKTS